LLPQPHPERRGWRINGMDLSNSIPFLDFLAGHLQDVASWRHARHRHVAARTELLQYVSRNHAAASAADLCKNAVRYLSCTHALALGDRPWFLCGPYPLGSQIDRSPRTVAWVGGRTCRRLSRGSRRRGAGGWSRRCTSAGRPRRSHESSASISISGWNRNRMRLLDVFTASPVLREETEIINPHKRTVENEAVYVQDHGLPNRIPIWPIGRACPTLRSEDRPSWPVQDPLDLTSTAVDFYSPAKATEPGIPRLL